MDGIPKRLPALLYAQNLQRRAARAGFDWPHPQKGIPVKIREELRELSRTGSNGPAFGRELGDVLFTLVNLARHRKVDAETALRDATKRFRFRVQKVEAMARRTGKSTASMSPRELDRLWTKAKRS